MNDVLEFLRSISGLLGSGAMAIAIAAWVRSRPDMRRAEIEEKKVELEGEAALWSEIRSLRDEADRERRNCDDRIARIDERNEAALKEMKGALRVLRHERNNISQGFNALLTMIKRLDNPQLSEIAATVEEMVAKGAEQIAIEKAALSVLPVKGRLE